jgi:hypothetical protein
LKALEYLSVSWSVGQYSLLLRLAGHCNGAVWAELTEILNNGGLITPFIMKQGPP